MNLVSAFQLFFFQVDAFLSVQFFVLFQEVGCACIEEGHSLVAAGSEDSSFKELSPIPDQSVLSDTLPYFRPKWVKNPLGLHLPLWLI